MPESWQELAILLRQSEVKNGPGWNLKAAWLQRREQVKGTELSCVGFIRATVLWRDLLHRRDWPWG